MLPILVFSLICDTYHFSGLIIVEYLSPKFEILKLNASTSTAKSFSGVKQAGK